MVLALRRAGDTSASLRNADRLFGVTTGNRLIKRLGVLIGPRLTPIGPFRNRAATGLGSGLRHMIDDRQMAFADNMRLASISRLPNRKPGPGIEKSKQEIGRAHV